MVHSEQFPGVINGAQRVSEGHSLSLWDMVLRAEPVASAPDHGSGGWGVRGGGLGDWRDNICGSVGGEQLGARGSSCQDPA